MPGSAPDRHPPPRRARRRWPRLALAVAIAALLWIGWTELHPSAERALRTLVHDRLDDWFPEVMRPPGDDHGLRPWPAATPSASASSGPSSDANAVGAPATETRELRAVLIHGLDEPGIIWDDLAPVLAAAGFDPWELRYPNDQGLDRSAAYLAAHWNRLPDDRAAVLIGHSMGGLVAREFVSRWRHPVGQPPQAGGAPVAGVVMAGTPNQGSDWARLRIWLEAREHIEDAWRRRFSLFAGLRDGLGEAKLDLRPGSDFLRALNARPWPDAVARCIIGGRLTAAPAWLDPGLDAAAAEVGSEALRARLRAWFDALGEQLGDGAVSVASLRLEHGPAPVLVNASHRAMLRRLFASDPQPPAIAPILAQLLTWSERERAAASTRPVARRDD